MTEDYVRTAADYFSFLAVRFPVMCASDEFHFLPRAVAAARYYDRLDDLAEDVVNDCVFEVRQFYNRFKQRAAVEKSLENRIDLELLAANAAGVLIELEKNRAWRCNPLFI